MNANEILIDKTRRPWEKEGTVAAAIASSLCLAADCLFLISNFASVLLERALG